MTKVCLPWQNCLSGQNIFVATKLLSQQIFVAANTYLSQQKFCHDKYTFVTTKDVLSWQTRVCHDRSKLVTSNFLSQFFFYCDKSFVARSILLSRQKTCFVATNTCLSRQNTFFVATKMIFEAAPANDKGGLGPGRLTFMCSSLCFSSTGCSMWIPHMSHMSPCVYVQASANRHSPLAMKYGHRRLDSFWGASPSGAALAAAKAPSHDAPSAVSAPLWYWYSSYSWLLSVLPTALA